MKIYQIIAIVLTTIVCVNLMIAGIFNFNIIETILRNQSFIESILYTIVGVAGIINLLLLQKK